jgi:ATP-dependent Clp protease adaptor protein ClpS
LNDILTSESDNQLEAQKVVMPKRRIKKKTKTTNRLKQLPPYKVVLHNDPISQAADVVKHVQQIIRLEEPEAIKKVKEAHETGTSVLLVTHKERAELYSEQFAACLPHKITVTAEKC